MDHQSKAIKTYILENVQQYSNDIVAITSKHFSVTRTTVHRHINYLIRQGLILKSGTTRNIMYCLKSSLDRSISYNINRELSEFIILETNFKDVFQQFSENIYDICAYVFTEIVNNAIDHSKGTKIVASTKYEKNYLSIIIEDDGIGLFASISNYFNLKDMRESVLQLSKGKMTTFPQQHTGEGIFFTSRVTDRFDIYANDLHFFRDNLENDWGFETLAVKKKGTKVRIMIHRETQIKLIDVFKQYQDLNNLSFSRTDILVKLSLYGDAPLISRSQAKRITLGLEKFNHITLDFQGVRMIGQGFVDELFRVFVSKHPAVTIDYVHANSDICFMIERGL